MRVCILQTNGCIIFKENKSRRMTAGKEDGIRLLFYGGAFCIGFGKTGRHIGRCGDIYSQ